MMPADGGGAVVYSSTARRNKFKLTALSASMAEASALRQPARFTPVLLIPHDGPSKLSVAGHRNRAEVRSHGPRLLF